VLSRIVRLVRAHPLVGDALVALVLVGLWIPIFAPRPSDGEFRELDWVSLSFVVASTAPLLLRRRKPTVALTLCWIMSFVHDIARVPSMVNYVAVLVALCSVATYRPRRISVPAGVLTIALTPIDMAVSVWTLTVGDYLMNLVFALMTWLFGDHLGKRRRQAIELEERADTLTREQQEYAGRMSDLLSQYVPAPVVRQLVEGGSSAPLPTGDITFVMTDVVGSTALWEAAPTAMRDAIRRHDEIVEDSVSTAGGAVVRPRGEGDSRFAVFVRPAEAVAAALSITDRLAAEPWPGGALIRVRTAVHTGTGDLRSGDYYGSDVNRCARIRSVAEPGQVLVSSATARLLGEDAAKEFQLREVGTRALKDLSEPERLFEVGDRRTASASETQQHG
jgi:class 3 adenylate cyclase